MKGFRTLVMITVIAVVSSFNLSAQKQDFNGTWKIDRAKSNLSEYYPTMITLTVQVKDNSLSTERIYDTGDGQEYPFTENLTLDGKEYKIVIYEMPRKTKATWSDQDGTIKLGSITTFSGSGGSADFISDETWKVDKTAKTLTISFVNKNDQGEITGAFIYNKAQ